MSHSNTPVTSVGFTTGAKSAPPKQKDMKVAAVCPGISVTLQRRGHFALALMCGPNSGDKVGERKKILRGRLGWEGGTGRDEGNGTHLRAEACSLNPKTRG